jgi:hypothetical protein
MLLTGPVFHGTRDRLATLTAVDTVQRRREPGLVGQHDRLDAIAETELLEDVGDVGLDGGLADVQLFADLRVGQAGRSRATSFPPRSWTVARVVGSMSE